MNLDTTYTVRFRVDKERRMLTEIARHVDLKESEVLRALVRGAFEALKEQEQENPKEAQPA